MPKVVKKARGLSPHRWKQNPLEKAFAEMWSEKLSHPNFNVMTYLLSPDNRPVVVTDREYEVAATVIQWLGSPVGVHFLAAMYQKAAKLKMEPIPEDGGITESDFVRLAGKATLMTIIEDLEKEMRSRKDRPRYYSGPGPKAIGAPHVACHSFDKGWREGRSVLKNRIQSILDRVCREEGLHREGRRWVRRPKN